MKHQKGVTIIEIMVMIAIIGILGSILVGFIKSDERQAQRPLISTSSETGTLPRYIYKFNDGSVTCYVYTEYKRGGISCLEIQ